MTAFVEAVEPLLWRDGTLRLIILFSCAFVFFFCCARVLLTGVGKYVFFDS